VKKKIDIATGLLDLACNELGLSSNIEYARKQTFTW